MRHLGISAGRLRVSEHRIDHGDLAFRARSTTGTEPRSTRFVLIHGVGMSHRYLARLHQRLAHSGDVHSIDLPGFGGLPQPGRSVGVPEMAAALAAVLGELGLSDALMVGHSMGAQWVVEMVASRPELARAVILLGPVVDDRARTVLAQSAALARDTLGEPIGGNAIVFTDYVRCGPRWYLAQVRQMVSYAIEDRVGAIQAPVLILRGADDTVSGSAWSRRLRERAPLGSVVTVPGHRHLVQYSAPRAVASAIRTFVEETAEADRATEMPAAPNPRHKHIWTESASPPASVNDAD